MQISALYFQFWFFVFTVALDPIQLNSIKNELRKLIPMTNVNILRTTNDNIRRIALEFRRCLSVPPGILTVNLNNDTPRSLYWRDGMQSNDCWRDKCYLQQQLNAVYVTHPQRRKIYLNGVHFNGTCVRPFIATRIKIRNVIFIVWFIFLSWLIFIVFDVEAWLS